MEKILQILGGIGFEWHIALANLVNFLIIFYFLNRFIFKKIGNVVSEREKRIQDGIDNATYAENALLSATEEKNEIIKVAHVEANNIVISARKKSDEVILDSVKKAEGKANEVLRQAALEVDRNRVKMEEEMKIKTVELITSGIRTILKEEMTTGKDELLSAKIKTVN